MAIKIKHRDPKTTDFKPEDIIINISEGTLFYKSKTGLFKVQGDNVDTSVIEFAPTEDIILKGHLIPDGSGSYDLGSRTNPWRDLHIMSSSVRFYDTEGELGKISFTRGEGFKIKDNINEMTTLSASIMIATTKIKSPTGSFEHYLGIMNGGSF